MRSWTVKLLGSCVLVAGLVLGGAGCVTHNHAPRKDHPKPAPVDDGDEIKAGPGGASFK